MATVNDIDTQALVGKYLQRQIITPTTDDASDTAEEIQALLETIATTFLLEPQVVLPLVFRARNSLRQLVQSDIAVLDFLIGAIADLGNPDSVITDTSDLIEAQTALVELDRLGRVGAELQATRRYNAAINRFLDNELAFFLKRNARKEFERSGVEAREDIFTALPQFEATHQVVADRLKDLQMSVTDFRAVGLNKLVSPRTIQEVRTSLTQLRRLIGQNEVSKTVIAIELLAGAASLDSISENTDVYDPTVSTVGGLPPGRTLLIRPEQIGATALSTAGPWDASGPDRVFSLRMNPLAAAPTSLAPEIPDVGVEDSNGDAAVYVTSSEATLVIPTDSTLYVQIVGAVTEEQEIPITSGTRTVAQILTDLNDGLGLVGATAIEFKSAQRFLIYGTVPAITAITIRDSSSGLVGTAFAVGGLTLTGQPLNAETVTIGVRAYIFETVFSDVADFVLIGATTSDSIDNLIAALNNTAGEGTIYGTGTAIHEDVTGSAGTGDALITTAKIAGAAANAISLAQTLTNGYWSTEMMVGGGEAIFNSDPSVHGTLGFVANQTSLTKGEFNSESLRDALEGRLPGTTLVVEGAKLRITSDTLDPRQSSLEFDTAVSEDVQGTFGFIDTAEALPSYLELVEDNVALSPEAEGVFIGSVVTAVEVSIVGSSVRSINSEAITAIEGTQIQFAVSPLPRGGSIDVVVTAPDVIAVQELIQAVTPFVGDLDGDLQNLQLVLSPILSSPTQAQTNDALRVLNRIRDKLTNAPSVGILEALDSVEIRLDRSPFSAHADTLVQSLEERGLDRAVGLLSTARFSEFFSLTKVSASRSSRMLLAMESFITQDVPISFDEEVIEDDQIPRGVNPDEDVLDARELDLDDSALVEDL